MTEKKLKPMAMLEAKARQLMLMIGFGFMAYIGGSLFSASLIMRVRDRVIAADSAVIAFLVQAVIGRLWILIVLPLLIHIVSRFIALPLWRTAILGALTGELFYAAIQIASVGADEAFADWVQNGVRIGTLITGVLFTVWAGKRGRAWADVRQKAADQAAVARKGQYDDFLKASTELAEKREAAAAAAAPAAIAPVAPPPTAGDGPTVPASPAPTAGDVPPTEPKPGS